MSSRNLSVTIRTRDIKPGDRFGWWEVRFRVEGHPQRGKHYLCRCSCGEEKVIAGFRLGLGETHRCKLCALKVLRARMLATGGRIRRQVDPSSGETRPGVKPSDYPSPCAEEIRSYRLAWSRIRPKKS